MAVQLEDLTPGAQVTGLTGNPGQPVTVVAAAWIGGNAVRLTYRTQDGKLDERILYRDHELGLGLAAQGPAYEFQADPRLFKIDPFRDVDFGDFNATGLGGNWTKEWNRGADPQ